MYTKGPWTAHLGTIDGYITAKRGKEVICSVNDSKNGELIAAVPELLSALEHCVAYFEKYKPEYCGLEDDRECSPYNDAIKAIAKAKGE